VEFCVLGVSCLVDGRGGLAPPDGFWHGS
jgi:hypothetical protein